MTTKQEKALAALLVCNTVKEAAAMAGVSHQTIYNYLSSPSFNTEYRARRKLTIDEATGALQLKLEAANRVTVELMEDIEVPPQVRLSAARTVLEYGYKAREQESILERIEVLERAEREQGGHHADQH